MTSYGNVWRAQSEIVCALLAGNSPYHLTDAKYVQVT